MAVVESSGLGIDSSNWRKFANCDGISEPESFPPNNGESIEEAKIVCRGCVSAFECLVYSRVTGVETGITRVMSAQESNDFFEARRIAGETTD
jgi:hypothetical protein